MKKFLAVALLSLSAASANAASFTFTGNLENRNDTTHFDFSLANISTSVRAWTDSFLSGVNFDPIIAVWQQVGLDYQLLGQNDDNPSVAAGQTYYDSGLTFANLAAGNYRLTVAAFPNFANGTLFSQGFQYDSQPISSHNRGTFFRVNIDGVDSASPVSPVPEPETYAMLLAGLGLMAGIARRRKKQLAA
jgi:hypothetical protein